jgi:hypothetical protein
VRTISPFSKTGCKSTQTGEQFMNIDANENADIRELKASEVDQASGGYAGLLVVAIALMGVAAAVYCEGKGTKPAQ